MPNVLPAELWFGGHKVNLSNFVFLQVGPGIGSGIVVENKILDGEFHASGEVGHMVLYEGEKNVHAEAVDAGRSMHPTAQLSAGTLNKKMVLQRLLTLP